MRGEHHATQRFTVPLARVVLIAAGFAYLLIGASAFFASTTTSGDRVFSAVFILPGAFFFIYRGWRSATVVVADDYLLLGSFLRTRRVPIDQVAGASVVVGNTGPIGIRRQFLVVSKIDGTVVRLTELNARPPQVPGPRTVVERCVLAINEVASPPP